MKKKPTTIKKKLKKINNLITELQWQSANHLSSNYDVIVLPNFENQKVAQDSNNRKLNRMIYTFSHYSFMQRLSYKCKMRGKTLLNVTEEFTSKTCGNCGVLNQKLGSSKSFKCESCNLCIDRDFNGARNILLKYLCTRE